MKPLIILATCFTISLGFNYLPAKRTAKRSMKQCDGIDSYATLTELGCNTLVGIFNINFPSSPEEELDFIQSGDTCVKRMHEMCTQLYIGFERINMFGQEDILGWLASQDKDIQEAFAVIFYVCDGENYRPPIMMENPDAAAAASHDRLRSRFTKSIGVLRKILKMGK